MKKGTWIALFTFAALLIAFLATREKEVSVGVRRLEVPSFDRSKVTELDVLGPKAVVLKRASSADGGWTEEDPSVPGVHAAEDGQVDSLVEAFSGTSYGDLVSDRSQRHAELEVDDAKGLHVKAVVQGLAKPIDLVFGKTASNGMTYVRQAGQPQVFLAKGRFSGLARRDANSWRKHAALELKPDNVQSVTVKGQTGQEYTLERGPDKTLIIKGLPKGFRFDAEAAQRTVQQLATLRAQDFADHPTPEMETAFQAPHDVVEAKLQDGKAVVMHVSGTPNKDGTVPVRIEGDPQTYLVSAYTKAELDRPLDGFRDLSLFAFNPDDVKSLSIRGPKAATVTLSGAQWKLIEPKKLPSGTEFDASQVSMQLHRLRGMHASRWMDPPVTAQRAGLSAAPLVEITLKGGKKQTLVFGKEPPKRADGQKEVFVKAPVDGAIYAVGEGERTRLEAGIDLFKPVRSPPGLAGGGGMQGLDSLPPEIRRQLEAQLRARGGSP